MRQHRKLAAIMFTDMVGYTVLMGDDERNALSLLEQNFRIQKPLVHQFRGQWLDEIGDGGLSSFESAVDAVYCALAIQQASGDQDFKLRIGLHLGDVVFRGPNVHGDGVNIASRVQEHAKPGGVTVSGQIYDTVRNHSNLVFADRGVQELKNVAHAISLYDVCATQPIDVADAISAFTSPAGFEKSIAVLPFVNMSDDPNNEYFSDGISEELLNTLAKIPDFHVVGRTSSFSFKGKDQDLREIAQKLGVAHILEGSVRKAGNQVRITAQLVQSEDGFHLWSETYDRALDDIFAIQDEIAAAVAAQLKVTLLGAAPTVQETHPDAYALFLQARHLSRQRTAEGWEQSNVLYQQALEIAPDYAAAWEGLANNYVQQAGIGLRIFDEGYTLAREAANKALVLNPDHARAHATLAWVATVYDKNLALAAQHLARAVELEPANPDILSHAALLAANLGRSKEEIALGEYLVARDPVHSGSHYNLGRSYRSAQRLDEAIASLNTALALSPGHIAAQYYIGEVLLLKGEPEAALAAMQQESFEVYRLIGLPMAYHALGQVAESDAALSELIEKYERDAAYNIAYVLAFRGEADRAFAWLDKAVAYKDPALSLIPTEPLFANLHGDSRWLPFLNSIGKSPEQLDVIEFKIMLPKQGQ